MSAESSGVKKQDIEDDILSVGRGGAGWHTSGGSVNTAVNHLKWQRNKRASRGCGKVQHTFFTGSPPPPPKTKNQATLHATHIHPAPWGSNQSLSCLQPVPLPQPAAAIKPINPSAEHDYDWFSRQTINLYLSRSLFWCGCTRYHEKASVVTAPVK